MAARGLGDGVADRVAAIGAAGHVLDFDDTHASSLAHLSAPTAPAALVLGATLGTTLGHAPGGLADRIRALEADFAELRRQHAAPPLAVT